MCSCHLPSSNRGQAATGFGDWTIMDSTVYFYSYTKEGLLDSSFQIFYHIRYGQPDLHLNTLVTRMYDEERHLVEERSFDYFEKTKQCLLESRRIKTYDPKGNLITDVRMDIKKSKPTLYWIYRMIYNQHHQEIIRFEKIRRIDLEPNFDSAMAHMDDIKIPKYDTTIVSSFYDSSGNLVTQTYRRPGESSQDVSHTTYKQGMKMADYIVNSTGDTTVIYHYDKEGDLTRKIMTYKKSGLLDGTDTCWYRGDKEVKSVDYFYHPRSKEMRVWQYDAKGNEIREMYYH